MQGDVDMYEAFEEYVEVQREVEEEEELLRDMVEALRPDMTPEEVEACRAEGLIE